MLLIAPAMNNKFVNSPNVFGLLRTLFIQNVNYPHENVRMWIKKRLVFLFDSQAKNVLSRAAQNNICAKTN